MHSLNVSVEVKIYVETKYEKQQINKTTLWMSEFQVRTWARNSRILKVSWKCTLKRRKIIQQKQQQHHQQTEHITWTIRMYKLRRFDFFLTNPQIACMSVFVQFQVEIIIMDSKCENSQMHVIHDVFSLVNILLT